MADNFSIINITDAFSVPINDDIIQRAFPILRQDIILIIGALPTDLQAYTFINHYRDTTIYTLDLEATRVPSERHLQVNLCDLSQYDKIPKHFFTKIIFDWSVLHHLINNVGCSAIFASLYEWLTDDGILFFYPLRVFNQTVKNNSVTLSIMMELLIKYFYVYKATIFNPEHKVIPFYPLEITEHMPPLEQQVELNKTNIMFRDYNIAIKKTRESIDDSWSELGIKKVKRNKNKKHKHSKARRYSR